jgi:uncharacterized protein (DUF2235 family)
MPIKNIVFCADGTWNGPGKDLDGKSVSGNPSNVLKMYRWLAGTDTAESAQFSGEAERRLLDAQSGALLQAAKYLDGVGYDTNPLVKALGGAFGAGIVARIVRGYTFISRNYQAGDRIFILGFSRGAYTARALAGLILEQGLLDGSKIDLSDKENAYRLGCAVWTAHQRQIKTASLLTRLEEALYDLPGFFNEAPAASSMITDVSLQAVAVWDTVGALGIPQYAGDDKRIDAFRFADTNLNTRVANGFHALSLDEQRADFSPTLWVARAGIVQTLFPGAHADVGGGYPVSGNESGLSDGALVWMQQRLASLADGANLLFGPTPAGIAADALGVAHQPWIHAPYPSLPTRPSARSFPDHQGLRADASVTQRASAGPVYSDPSQGALPYAPKNLPIA